MKQNPYQMLLEEFKKYANSVDYPKTKTMWLYPKERLSEGWALEDLWQRASAAEQLGFDVILEAKEDGLHVKYIQKRPTRPWRV